MTISGAASGIGRATAKLLSSRGYILSVADRNSKGLDETLRSLREDETPNGVKHMATTVDITDSQQVNAWIDKTVQEYGGIDGATNIAGILYDDKLLRDETDERFANMMSVNVNGVFYCLRAQLNTMKDGSSIVGSHRHIMLGYVSVQLGRVR